MTHAPSRIRCGIVSLALGLLLLVLVACSRPLADSAALAGERSKQAVVGYERSSYVYSVKVPGSNRHVSIVTREPVDRPLDYEDYLYWKKHGELP